MILSDQPLMFPTGRTSLLFGVVDIVKFSLMVPSMPVRLGRVRSTLTNSALVFGAKDNSGNYNSSSPNIGSYASVWLDDVRFYDAYLTDTEVEQIYGGGLGDVGQPWIVVNSPTAATAATGMVFTYQISATNLDPSFSLGESPSWMSVNSATGEVSGTQPLVESSLSRLEHPMPMVLHSRRLRSLSEIMLLLNIPWS